MEPVTHFLTGACLGRAGFNRKTAYATLAMTLAAEAPDIDILWGLRGPVAGFEHHRGITHTFVGGPFVALAVTALVWIIHRLRKKKPEQPVRWWLVWLFAWIATLSHLLLDFTNNYGVRPFFPFNPRWYAWDIVFIFEPLIFLALLGALVLPAIFGLADREIGARRTPFRGRGWAIAALIFVAVLYAVRNAEHQRALELARAAAGDNDPVLRVAAEPLPINPFRWNLITETPGYYQTAEANTLSGAIDTGAGTRIYKPPVTLAVLAAKRSWLGRAYLDWARFPVVEDRGSEAVPGADPPQPGWSTIEFEDVRFVDTKKLLALRSNPGANNRPDPALAAWVYVGPEREIEGMYMSGREQK